MWFTGKSIHKHLLWNCSSQVERSNSTYHISRGASNEGYEVNTLSQYEIQIFQREVPGQSKSPRFFFWHPHFNWLSTPKVDSQNFYGRHHSRALSQYGQSFQERSCWPEGRDDTTLQLSAQAWKGCTAACFIHEMCMWRIIGHKIDDRYFGKASAIYEHRLQNPESLNTLVSEVQHLPQKLATGYRRKSHETHFHKNFGPIRERQTVFQVKLSCFSSRLQTGNHQPAIETPNLSKHLMRFPHSPRDVEAPR